MDSSKVDPVPAAHDMEDAAEVDQTPMGPGVARMQRAFNYFRYYMEKGGARAAIVSLRA